MKFSDSEKRTIASALGFAIAASGDVRQVARYENLRKKLDRALSQVDRVVEIGDGVWLVPNARAEFLGEEELADVKRRGAEWDKAHALA